VLFLILDKWITLENQVKHRSQTTIKAVRHSTIRPIMKKSTLPNPLSFSGFVLVQSSSTNSL